jgi:hypothetical protein
MIGRDLRLYVYSSGTLQAVAGRVLRAEVEWPLSAVGSLMVELPALDDTVLELTPGRDVRLYGPEGEITRGTILDPPMARLVDDEPTFRLRLLNGADVLNQTDVLRRAWTTATALSTILGAGSGTPPGLLNGTGWTLTIDGTIGAKTRSHDLQYGPLLRAIAKVVEDGQAAWWADPISEVLYVDDFGSDSGVVLAKAEQGYPGGGTDSTVLWIQSLQQSGEPVKANRLYAVGGSDGEDRVILPATKPSGGTYTVVEITGHMGGDQIERYIQDSTSITAYGTIEGTFSDVEIDTENLSTSEAEDALYWACQAALIRWKDPVALYRAICVKNEIGGIGRQTVTPGSQVRVFYSGYVDTIHPGTLETIGTQYVDLNDLLYVTNVKRSFTETGAETVTLDLADTVEGYWKAFPDVLREQTRLSQQLVTRGATGGSAPGGGTVTPSQLSTAARRRHITAQIRSSSAATTFEYAIGSAHSAGVVKACSIVTDSTLTGQDTDYCTLAVYNKGDDGTKSDIVCSKAFTNGTNATVFDETSLGTVDTDYDNLADGDTLTFVKTVSGSGLATPNLAVVVEWEPD